MKKLALLLILGSLATGCMQPKVHYGADGTNGKSCTVEQSESGAMVTCPDGSTVFIPNGQDGSDGADGIQGPPGQDGQDGQDGKDADFSAIKEMFERCIKSNGKDCKFKLNRDGSVTLK